MANFYDIGDVGPDTDPTPEQGDGGFDDLHEQDAFWDGLLDDADNQREPGVGEAYNGEDPSEWSTQGDAEEPDVQEDAVPPTFIQEWAEQENRQLALLRLRGIHIPDVRGDVDPDTGEILTQDTDPILTWEESVAELQQVFTPIFNAEEPSTPPAVPPAITPGVWELPAGQTPDSMAVPDPVADAVVTVDPEAEPAALPDEVDTQVPNSDQIAEDLAAEELYDDIIGIMDKRDRSEYLIDQFNQQTITQLSQLVSAALNAEYPSVTTRNIEYFERGLEHGLTAWDPYLDFDASVFNDEIGDLIIQSDTIVDDEVNDLLDLAVPSQLIDFSDIVGGIDQDTSIAEFNQLGSFLDDDLL